MKVVTLNNLKEFLSLMKNVFGAKELATKHRNALDTYILNIDYTALEFNTDLIVSGSATSACLGNATLGTMVLGNP